MEKSKAQHHLHEDSALYKMAWFLHFISPRNEEEARQLHTAERGDSRLIKDKIESEFDVWSVGSTHYY